MEYVDEDIEISVGPLPVLELRTTTQRGLW
jgi:hypothetical protein